MFIKSVFPAEACRLFSIVHKPAMKLLGYVSLSLTLFVFLPGRALGQCGVERWSVKTGSDQDAGLVNLSSAAASTIVSLSGRSAPNPIPDSRRVQPTETTLFVLNATLTKYVLAYDSDYHMVLTDSAGRTMIAEVPSPSCVGPGSPFAAGIARARAQFDAMFTATNDGTEAPAAIRWHAFLDLCRSV